MSATEPWTVLRLLTWTTEYLRENGSNSARLDAEVLLAHARGCERIGLYTDFQDEPNEETKVAFREMVRRRAEGAPVAYLVGYKEFYSATFEVNSDVLIPRPETEHLIVEALDQAKKLVAGRQDSRPLRIADVGTGSGNIAITMALHLPECHVTATDISPAALAVAKRNFERHRIETDRYALIEGDLLSGCDSDQPFDLILSNPPYVSQSEYEQIGKTVRDHEPRQALVAGPTGAEVIERLLEQAPELLTADGYLLFEFSPMLAERVSALIGHEWREPHPIKDLAGHTRLVRVQRIGTPATRR